MLLVRLPANNKLLVIKYLESQSHRRSSTAAEVCLVAGTGVDPKERREAPLPPKALLITAPQSCSSWSSPVAFTTTMSRRPDNCQPVLPYCCLDRISVRSSPSSYKANTTSNFWLPKYLTTNRLLFTWSLTDDTKSQLTYFVHDMNYIHW